MEFLEVIPDPVCLIESMRAVGYTAEAAIADIIDNSLSAQASAVQVKYNASGAPFVAILDDGHGMTADELTKAMRHGSSNPTNSRSASDLGRFGLGLKTASLSQCRKLTVVSKKNGSISARRWDLDVVHDQGKWVVVIPPPAELAELPMYGRLVSQPSGTLVVWQDLDRLTAGARNASSEMTTKMQPLLEHLALVFHRFTKAEGSNPQIAIAVNSVPLPQRDPFLRGNSFGQELEGQTITHERGQVRVTPFVLPPVDKLSAEEVAIAGGREGLRGTQGFYVYRSRRLVIWGTWFGLVPKEEFYKLTRVQVDIPNTFDDLWALDIKKSAAHPPDAIRVRLKELIPHFADTSKKTVTYNGRVTNATKAFVPLWLRIEKDLAIFRYEPNQKHPLIQRLSRSLGDQEQRHLQMILDVLGAALPYQGIYADMCGDHRNSNQDDLIKEMSEMAEDLMSVTGLGIEEILDLDPLCQHPNLRQLVKKALEK